MTSSAHPPAATESIGVRLTVDEKAQLEALAAAEGVSVSLFVYRRVMNRPDAQRPRGRRPKVQRAQPEELFQMTG